MENAKVIICGSREITEMYRIEHNVATILYELKLVNPLIISGCAKGVDRLGEKFARKYGLRVKKFPAHWKKYGKNAGKMRNQKMVDFCAEDTENPIMIAFPIAGRSAGTWDAIKKAEEKGIEVYIFEKIL